VWIGGSAEPAREGVREAEALTIDQLLNRVGSRRESITAFDVAKSSACDCFAFWTTATE